MRKTFSAIIILLAFIICVGCMGMHQKAKAFADGVIDTSSKSALLMDADTKTIVYSSNENLHLPIASMNKIMTLLLCFEEIDNGNLSFDEDVLVSKNASGMGGSQIFLEDGATYKVEELIKGIVVASANDACVALAERLYGSEENFVQKMNEKAYNLNMNNTNFVNCTGLPKSGQFSCAKDVALMFSELIKHKDYFRFSNIWLDEISHPNDRKTQITNTNKLVRFYEGCDSGKTGFTSEAGHCLTASAIRNGTRLIAVVISAPDSKTRFYEVSQMFNYGFSNYQTKVVINNDTPLEIPVSIVGGKKDCVSVVAESPIKVFCKKNEQRAFEIDFNPVEKVKAPIYKGDILGVVSIYENGLEIDKVNVLANEDVLSKTYFDYVLDISNNWALI